jgi:cystathionine beta-lyase/cystathionine gamma-synthase
MSMDHPPPGPAKDAAPAPAWHPETAAVRVASPRTPYGENSEALFLTSGFVQPSAEAAAARFAGDEEGYTYARYGNPTTASFEQRLAALEGTEAAIATSSGMAAILMLCLGLLKAGDHVVCSQSMFGATIKLIGTDLAKFGVHSTFVPQTDLDAWRAALRPQTRLLLAETPTNPLTEVCDIAALADIAHRAGALLAVDNCFATPALQRPAALGADIVVHSGTKYLDGQGRVMAGALCARAALVQEAFLPVLRSAGMTLAPFNAWVALKGLETLHLRMQAQSATALRLAQWLQGPSGRGARALSRAALPPAARAGLAAAVRLRRSHRRLRGARRQPRAGPGARLRRARRAADPVVVDQPRRHENPLFPSREHLARAPVRGAAPGRGHLAGAHSRLRGAGTYRRHRDRPRAWPRRAGLTRSS